MIDRVEEVNGREIRVAQDLSLSHAGTVWDGAIVMVYFWNKNRELADKWLRDRRVLELGAGTGLVGVAAASFNPVKVYLTDLPEYLGILETNAKKNDKLSSH